MPRRRAASGKADVLAYAFNAEGSLDPATKLLDIGLDQHTPIAALHTLTEEPLHISVALHEITHFASLENTLGHLLGFLAMGAKTKSEAIEDESRRGATIDGSWITSFAVWHRKYRLLVELWRPLLEGLATYAQTHAPDEQGDALIEPVELLWYWKIATDALKDTSVAPQLEAARNTVGDGFLRAIYRSIREGPQLLLGERTLAAGLEFLQPMELRPYFLGQAYLRSLQQCLAGHCQDFAQNELFFNLVLRILRSSTRGLLSGNTQWDQPAAARRIYNWIDIVRAAPSTRIAALRAQPDAVDVLHFLATGEERRGYSGWAVEDMKILSHLVPEFWNSFESEMTEADFGRLAKDLGDSPPESAGLAMRVVTGWIRGSMSLNLSLNGMAWIVGWIPQGLSPMHALALRVEDAVWWLAADNENVVLLAGPPDELPILPSDAMLHATGRNRTSRGVLINSFLTYVEGETLSAQAAPKMMPVLRFELASAKDPTRSVLAEIAPARGTVVRPHLRVLADRNDYEMHGSTMQLRHVVRDALAPADLAQQLEDQGDEKAAEALRVVVEQEDLAAARVQAQVERRILASLLQREPRGADLELLSQGVGVVPGADVFKARIAAAYARPIAVDNITMEYIRQLNARACATIGKAIFGLDVSTGTARYQGLWAEIEPQHREVESP